MSVEKARFSTQFFQTQIELKIEAIRSHGRVWKFKGEAFVEGKNMADAQWSVFFLKKESIFSFNFLSTIFYYLINIFKSMTNPFSFTIHRFRNFFNFCTIKVY